MSDPRKGMSSQAAAMKKIAGHVNEHDFVALIGGVLNLDSPSLKKDILDKRGRTYSVKSGKKWQIFLYSRKRLETNTVLQGIGKVAPLMVACIASLPETREKREANPTAAKLALQAPMRKLATELRQKNILKAFMIKAAFEAGQVDFWAILDPSIDQTRASPKEKEFHVFDAKEVVNELCRNLQVRNSEKRGRGQTDAQKVVFRDDKQLGEIELRTDPQNWGRMKFWLDAGRTFNLLKHRIPGKEDLFPQVTAYGKARRIAR